LQSFSELERRFGEMLQESVKDVSFHLEFYVIQITDKTILILQHYIRLNDPYLQTNVQQENNGRIDYMTSLSSPNEDAPKIPNKD
jgi:hypothetical protein